MTKLIINRHDGLGSRINNLICGIYLSKKINYELVINWVKNEECSCLLSDLFCDIDFVEYPILKKTERFGVVLNDNFFKKIFGDFMQSKHPNEIIKFISKDKETNVFLRNYTNKIERNTFKSIFNRLNLNSKIKNKLQIFNVINLKDIIGVHVRRGDVSKYRFIELNKYFNFLDKRNIKIIFLSSENEKVYFKFSKKYIVIRNRQESFDRNTVVGIQDSLVDMILLSRCKYILSSESQFSRCAGSIGNIKNIILKNNKKKMDLNKN